MTTHRSKRKISIKKWIFYLQLFFKSFEIFITFVIKAFKESLPTRIIILSLICLTMIIFFALYKNYDVGIKVKNKNWEASVQLKK